MDFNNKKIEESIRRVLEIEEQGIQGLMNTLDDSVMDVVQCCHKCTGKIVLTGMGKSGLIARKISATMASLGTPSFFLHPAEAAHGDLGALQKNDVVMMLSNSGETEELIQLVPTIKMLKCSLIGIFCKTHSTLSGYCDLTVVLPIEVEACINNLAPTTSTTVALALGDALAVVLSEMNGFSEKEFALFHPKGTLGKKLLVKVDSLCSKEMSNIAVKADQTIYEILFTITKNRLGAVAVIDEKGFLLGLVSDGDIRRAMEKRKEILLLRADEIMTKDVVSVKADRLAIDTFYLMQEKKISVVPVVTENHLLMGMVSLHEIIQVGIA